MTGPVVDQGKLAQLQGIESLLSKMGSNKDARALFLKARKMVEPDAVIPELDATEPVNAAVDEVKKMVQEVKDSLAKDAADREAAAKQREFSDAWEAQKKKVQDREGYYDETITEIEKLAKERVIPDFEAAAALWDKQHPPAPLASPNGFSVWGQFDAAGDEVIKKSMEGLMNSKGEDESSLSNLIRMGLAEARGQQFVA